MAEKSKKELANMHWRERYAYESQRTFKGLQRRTEEELIEKIEKNLLDHYFAVWRAIGRIGTVEKAAMPLWRFLQRSPGKHKMLHRYHCAAALFRILDMPDPASKSDLRKRVQWDHQGEEERQKALEELKRIIEMKQAQSET